MMSTQKPKKVFSWQQSYNSLTTKYSLLNVFLLITDALKDAAFLWVYLLKNFIILAEDRGQALGIGIYINYQ